MTQDEWEKLKKEVTWSREEQDKVTAHVDRLDRYLGNAISALDSILHAIADASGFTGKRDEDAEMLIEHTKRLRVLADAVASDVAIGDGNPIDGHCHGVESLD